MLLAACRSFKNQINILAVDLKLISGSQDVLRGARSRIRRVDEGRSERVVKTTFVYRLKPVDGDAPFYVRKIMG